MVPSSDITIERDFCKYLPAEIDTYVTRMPLGEVTPERLSLMADNSSDYAQLLADVEPDLIVYGCTSGSFIGGKGFDEKLEKQIRSVVNVPVITTARAVVDCLRALNQFPIALLTPYTNNINQIESDYFEANGLPVVDFHGMQIVKDLDIGLVPPNEIQDFVLKHNHKAAKSVFVSCTNLKTLDILIKLRTLLKKPIVTSNLAAMWALCRHLQAPMKHEIFTDVARL
jgi:maleate isomerase